MFKVGSQEVNMGADFNLYEFPEGHSGSRCYVSVRGHAKSVPAPYTYKGADGLNYVHPDFGGTWEGYKDFSHAVEMPMYIRDIGEYTSTLDGARITSRSAHRDHMKRHDVIEMGNERPASPRPDTAAVSRGDSIRAVKSHLEKVKAMPQNEYDAQITQQKAAAMEG